MSKKEKQGLPLWVRANELAEARAHHVSIELVEHGLPDQKTSANWLIL